MTTRGRKRYNRVQMAPGDSFATFGPARISLISAAVRRCRFEVGLSVTAIPRVSPRILAKDGVGKTLTSIEKKKELFHEGNRCKVLEVKI